LRVSLSAAVHLVAEYEAGDVPADGLDRAGDVDARDAPLGRADSEADEADEIGAAGDHVPGAPIDAGGADTDEDLSRPDLGRGDLLDAQDLAGLAVFVLDDGLHGDLPRVSCTCCPASLPSRLRVPQTAETLPRVPELG
jgi:hypothetical protein